MKHFYLLFIMVFFMSWQMTYANETEPNNAAAKANTLAVNGSNSGKINPAGDVDWWKVTTKAEGKLNITLTTTGGKSVAVYLYDNDTTTLLKSDSSDTTFVQSKDGLAAGTYYIKVVCVSATDTAGYKIADALTKPSLANDAEPNNTKSQALTLPLNNTDSGHVGYYYNHIRDTTDWYKITTTATKKLKLKLSPANGQSITLSLYANNGNSLIAAGSGGSSFSVTTDGLKADNYYVKIKCTSSNGFTPYTLTDSIFTTKTDTLVLPVNYREKDKLDTPGDTDWWKVTTGADGKLSFTLTPLAGKYLWLYLYDRDHTTLLNSSYSNAAFVQSTDGLAAGTYYVKIAAYYATDTSSYSLADTLKMPKQANDVEPNSSRAKALTFTQNSTQTGHVGYYYNNKRDTADWYKITTKGEGLLKLSLTPANSSYVWIYLYDNDGTTLLNSSYSNAAFVQSTDGLAAGTYYVKINCYYNSDFAPYTLTNSLVKPAVANDTEPNDSRAQALTLNQNSTVTGHVGYYYNNKRDTADWYKVTTNADGMLNLQLTTANGSYTWVYVYDNNGTTLLNSTYTNTSLSLNTDGLAAGTFYVKVNCYYNNNFTPYTLTDSLKTYSYAKDAEPNKYPYQGKAITANSTVTGHAGFYYNSVRDSLDWWKLNYTGTGNLKFVFNLAPKKINGSIPYVWFYVYKDTLAAPVYQSYFNTSSNVISLSSLAKANYYIKIITYYNSDYVTYSFSNSFTVPSLVTPADFSQRGINAQMIGVADEVATYPNPASSRFHIQVSGSKANFTSIILRDADGKQVWSQLNTASILSGAGLDVNVSSLPSGIYFLQMTHVNKKMVIKKIVIAK